MATAHKADKKPNILLIISRTETVAALLSESSIEKDMLSGQSCCRQ
jgi:hypothetical protein